MPTKWILTKREGNIFYITLHRPEKRNALHGEMITELLTILKQIASDATIRLLMLQGAGDCFCAGGDIAWMQEVAHRDWDSNYQDAVILADCLYQLYTLPIPTIALAQGVTLGGGVGLLCVCDIVVAAHNATFGFSEVKIGLSPSTISPYVVSAIGERYARYYFLTGERFSAANAKQMGLVHLIADQDRLLYEGMQQAAMIMSNGELAIIATKSLLHAIRHEKITADLSHLTATHLAKLRTSKEAQEGLTAFLEKRNPAWSK